MVLKILGYILLPLVAFLGIFNFGFMLCFVMFLLPFKILARKESHKLKVMRWMDAIQTQWLVQTQLLINIFLSVKIEVDGLENISIDDEYLLIANHQSWADIIILFTQFNKKIHPMKFFLKKELFYVPLLGIGCWAMGMPFMRRYSKKFIKKNPHRANEDLLQTQKFCEQFAAHPLTIVNFIEGTRFTQAKHKAQQSPYTYLLRPKAGGIAYVLESMQGKYKKILDVTIIYENNPSFVHLLSNQLKHIKLIVRVLDIPEDILNSNYSSDVDSRLRCQSYVNMLWKEKDELIASSKL